MVLGAGAGHWCWSMQRGGVRHRRATEWARAATAPGGPDAVTALNAWSSWTWTKRSHRQLATAIVASTATRSTPRWPHRPCIGCLHRQAPNNSAFPAWDRLLGMSGWGDLWGHGACACLASQGPVKSVRDSEQSSHRIWEDAMGWESHLATGDEEGSIVPARRWMAQTNLSRATVTGIPSRL